MLFFDLKTGMKHVLIHLLDGDLLRIENAVLLLDVQQALFIVFLLVKEMCKQLHKLFTNSSLLL